jgi:hypothetical protein
MGRISEKEAGDSGKYVVIWYRPVFSRLTFKKQKNLAQRFNP